MKDLNFFSSYNKKKDKSLNKQSIMYVVLALAVLAVVGYGIYNYMIIRGLNQEIDIAVKHLEELGEKSSIKELKQKEKEIASYKKNVDKIKLLDDYVAGKDIINDMLLDDIESNMPANVFLKSMILRHDAIKIKGTSQDKESIAQFQHNLREMGIFEELYIPHIAQNEDYFEFSIDFKFRQEEEKKDGA